MTEPDYIVQEQDKTEFPTSTHITRFLVYAAVQSCHPTLDRTDSRIFARIQRKFHEAIELEQKPLSFDRTEIEWILENLEKSSLPPNLSMWKWTLVESLLTGEEKQISAVR